MSITHDQYRRARTMAEPAARVILEAIRPNNRGRKTLDPIIFLTGALLAIDNFNIALVTRVHKVLTHDLTLADQLELGVRTRNAEGEDKVVTLHELYMLTKRITKMCDFSKKRASLLSSEERHRRRNFVDEIVAALLDPTLIPRPADSHDYALDGSGIWAAEKSKKKIPDEELEEEMHEEDMTYSEQNSALAELETTDYGNCDLHRPNPGKGQHGASDASIGGKTGKDGTKKLFFGYSVEAMVRVVPVAAAGERSRIEPNLVERLVVTPAGTDVVNPCLRMIDRMLGKEMKIGSLLVDRHYSYKKYERWVTELINRDIEQVADMHQGDQGFREWEGMKIAAGWVHCPSTPSRLSTIPSLSPNSNEDAVELFNALITERQSYAAKRINPLDKEGKIRFGCPALNGTVGCPLRIGTEATAIELNLPMISNPPEIIGRPTICTQKSVQLYIQTLEEKRAMKLQQRYYWGSKQWRLSYARRTFVEGWFGVLKNTSSTGFHRGSHQFVGLPMVSIVVAMAAATTNLRLLRRWHEETGLGDPNHPLLSPDQPHHGFAELTEDQANMLMNEGSRTRKAA